MNINGAREMDLSPTANRLVQAQAHAEAPALVRIPLRPGVVVSVQYPYDISAAEAGKVAKVVAALAKQKRGQG